VRVDVYLTPTVEGGVAGFQLDVESGVDTGVLGNLFGGLVGGLLGLLLGVLSGGLLLPFAAVGFAAGVLAIEVAESVVAGVVTRIVRARIDEELVPPPLICDNGAVALALPGGDGGVAVSVLNAIPTSIRVATQESYPLFRRHILVAHSYETVVVDGSGIPFTAIAARGEVFEPIRATLVDAIRSASGQPLTALVYDTADAQGTQIAVGEVVARAAEDELPTPLTLSTLADVRPVVPGGQIPVVCLTPRRSAGMKR
jgi:hypothetical protein